MVFGGPGSTSAREWSPFFRIQGAEELISHLNFFVRHHLRQGFQRQVVEPSVNEATVIWSFDFALRR